jgi:S-adenosylmethionine decarboxylase proenzyme
VGTGGEARILAAPDNPDHMHGLHLTADLRGCDRTRATLTDPARLRAACLAAVEEAGLNAVAELFHRFQAPAGSAEPPGVTGVVLLAESHLAVHTWPELGVVTLDVYVCNLGQDHSAQAEALLARLMAEFAPREAQTQHLMRGA